jgi:DNA-binding response OmpR family regulator
MPSPKRILLIDHEPHLTASVNAALEATGRYLIQRAAYSTGAIDAAINFRPHLILVDAEPEHLELDGVAQKIHAERSLHEVPVVCLTNLAQEGKIGSVGFLGGYIFLANPFHLEDMVTWIGQILKERRSSGTNLA